MRRLLPLPVTDSLGLDQLVAHYSYARGGSATVRANMVSTVDGAITLDGRAQPISGAADWYLFGLQRALADVIVVGAGTARAEGYGPGRVRSEFAHLRAPAGQPAAPTLALVTRSGAIDPNGDYLGGPARAIVITCDAGRAQLPHLDANADVIVAGDTDVDLRSALQQVSARGHRRILTEGGPHLLGSLLDADLLDEMVTTLSPMLVGGDAGRMVAGAGGGVRDLSLVGLLEQDGVLFCHYRRERGPS